MSLQKNVASQKIGFLMVDGTDFATPETGISVSGKYSRDGGGLSSISNTVSEISSGLYILTLSQTETNADLLALQFTGTGCADQWLIFYPDTYSSELSNILSTIDSAVISTLDRNQNDLDSILADLSSISNITSQILVDTGTTLENRQQSILADTQSIIADLSSISNIISQILVDTGTTLPATLSQMDSLLSDISSDIGNLGAGQDSAILSTIDAVLSTLDGPITSSLSDIQSTVHTIGGDSNNITSILSDTKSILSTVASVLVDTKTTLPATLSQMDSLLSDISSDIGNLGAGQDSAILSTLDAISSYLDGPITSDLSNIESIVGNLGGDSNNIASILADTQSILSTLDGPVESQLTQTQSTISNVLSTIDGPVISDLSNIESIVGAVLTDTGTTLENRQTSILTRVSQLLSTLDGPILSTLDRNQNDIDSVLVYANSDIGELSADVGTTPTPREALMLLYMWLRNNTAVTSAARSIRNNAGATIMSAAVADDGTTFTQGKLA